MTKKEKKYFEKATQMATNSNMDIKMGCVITYKGKIISESCNQFKTHPLQAEYDVEREDFEEGHIFNKAVLCIAQFFTCRKCSIIKN